MLSRLFLLIFFLSLSFSFRLFLLNYIIKANPRYVISPLCVLAYISKNRDTFLRNHKAIITSPPKTNDNSLVSSNTWPVTWIFIAPIWQRRTVTLRDKWLGPRSPSYCDEDGIWTQGVRLGSPPLNLSLGLSFPLCKIGDNEDCFATSWDNARVDHGALASSKKQEWNNNENNNERKQSEESFKFGIIIKEYDHQRKLSFAESPLLCQLSLISLNLFFF